MVYQIMMSCYVRGPFHASQDKHETILTLEPGVTEHQIESWSTYIPCLKYIFEIERMENGTPKKLTVSEEVVAFLGKWLSSYSEKFVSKTLAEADLDELMKVVRALRNASSTLKIQNFILLNTKILDDLKILFEVINLELPHDCLKFILQFLNNMTSSNAEATRIVHMKFMQYIELCFDKKIHIYESSALLYNISLMITISNENIIRAVLDALKEHNYSEFLYFFLENQLSLPHFWKIYEHLSIKEKLILLELIKYLRIQNGTLDLHDDALSIFTKTFLNSANIIFQTKAVENTEIHEVSLLLEIISSISSDTKYSDKLKSNKDLLINVGILLMNIHRLGKDSDNCFTPVQRLVEGGLENISNDHPAFGFKADLIRIIGNICWKNTEMQNLVRTAELIPIILDCCNIDEKNPFIIQWAILAVKNLCENNIENQRIIAGLHKKGAMTNERLNELGITLQNNGENSVGIISLDALRNNK